jgi:two-component system cell cycle sensor histidine kinase PleC
MSVMTSSSSETAGTNDPDAELDLRRLETAARYLYMNMLPVPLVLAAISALLAQWHEPRPIAAWALAALGSWTITMVVLHRFQNDARRAESVTRWTIAICASLFISTTTFALMGLIFWVDGDRLNNILCYVTLAGGLACAGAQSAPSTPVAVTNLTPYAVTFVLASLLNESYPIAWGVAALQTFYVGLVAIYTREVKLMSDEMLLLRMDKRDLIRKLQGALTETQTARQKAEAASRAKSEFLANMSHELRTPLNAILGFSEIIKDKLFGNEAADRYAEYGGHIHFGGRHLLGLINDILDLAKIEAGKRELDESNVELLHVAREAMSLVEPQASQKALEVTLDVPQPVVVLADERALRQVIANLLSNAVKFTPSGGRVAISVSSTPTGDVLVSVTDTGAGIAPEDMKRVLEQFGQGRHDIVSCEDRGTGLGLPIVKGLVELHGGSLSIESQPGQGTTVQIRLPQARVVLQGTRVHAA